MTRAGRGSLPGRPKRTSWEPCKAEGCDKTTQGGSLGFCHAHYVASRRGVFNCQTGQRLRPVLRVMSYGMGARCSVEGCGCRPKANGLCHGHWQRQKKGMELGTPIQSRTGTAFVKCLVTNCEQRAVSRGMCQKHANHRQRGLISADGTKLREKLRGGRPRSKKYYQQYGYNLVWAPAGHPGAQKSGLIPEHRLMLERALGRYLESWEAFTANTQRGWAPPN